MQEKLTYIHMDNNPAIKNLMKAGLVNIISLFLSATFYQNSDKYVSTFVRCIT